LIPQGVILLTLFSQTLLPTEFGTFNVSVFRNENQEECVALTVGDVTGQEHVLARVHSSCFTGEVLGSLKCDCKPQLEYAMKALQQEGRGVIFYLFQEGRGIGLGNKIKAYALQDQGYDTVDANLALGFQEDHRTYEDAIAMLNALEIKSVRLLTNNPLKVESLKEAGIPISGRVPIEVGMNKVNEGYLKTKQERMGHMLSFNLNEGVIHHQE
jgi:GTP cyclohydrolase II